MVLKGGRKSFVVSLPTYRFEKSASLLFLKWRVTSWGQPKKDDSNLKLSLFFFLSRRKFSCNETFLSIKFCIECSSLYYYYLLKNYWHSSTDRQRSKTTSIFYKIATQRFQRRDSQFFMKNSNQKNLLLASSNNPPKLSIQLWFSKIWISRQNTI